MPAKKSPKATKAKTSTRPRSQQKKPTTTTTTERPPSTPTVPPDRPVGPVCGCDSTAEIFTQIGSLPPVRGLPLRIHVTVSSTVTCDEATPQHCYYVYAATAVIEIRQPRRGARPAAWVAEGRRNAFIQAFTVHDDVNKTEKPDRIDQTSLSLGEWFPKAPQKEKTKVTLELVGSNRGKWQTTINRKIELCVPKLDNPICPVP